MSYVSLALFLLVVAVFWSGVLIVFMGRTLLRPPRMTDAKALYRLKRLSPEDLGLAFTAKYFTIRDTHTGEPLSIAAWWIAAASPSDKSVILVHGYGDAKVGGIAWAPLWHGLGFNVLAVDLRAHGDSGGRNCTAGFYERDDLDQVIDAMRAEKPAAAQTLVLFGASLGAAVVAATAARRADLAAVVMESPYADYRSAVRVHMRRRGYPLITLSNAVCRMAEWISASDFRLVRPAVTVPLIKAPLLVVYGDADPLIDGPTLSAALTTRAAGSVTHRNVFPGVPHVMALAHAPDAYEAVVRAFLRDAKLI